MKPAKAGSVLLGILTACALIIYAGAFVLQVQKNPLRLDEVDYFQSMKNVVDLGLPIYYAGEVSVSYEQLLHLSTRHIDGQRFDFYRFKPETGIRKETFFALTQGDSRYTYAMWHPPLYIYLGAPIFLIAPLDAGNSALLRYFNLLFAACALAGMAALCRELYPRGFLGAAAASVMLFSLNSLAVNGALLIDPNATLGPCLATWFAVTLLRSSRKRGIHLGLVAAIALACLANLGIATVLIATSLLYMLVSRKSARPMWPLASLSLGLLLFAAIYWGACRVLGLPASQPFLHSSQQMGTGAGLSLIADRVSAALRYSLWYGRQTGALVLLAGAVLGGRLLLTGIGASDGRRLLPPIAVVSGFLILGSLKADAYGFPKYILFLLPLLLVWVSGELVSALLHSSSKRPGLRVVWGIMLIVVVLAESRGLWDSLRSNGGTLYAAGEQGIASLAQAVHAQTSEDEVILSPKDIGFHSKRKFVQWHGALLADADLLSRSITGQGIRYLAISRRGWQAASEVVAAYVSELFAVSGEAEDFLIFQMRQPGASPSGPDANLLPQD